MRGGIWLPRRGATARDGDRQLDLRLTFAAVSGALATGITVVIALSNAIPAEGLVAVGRGLMVAVPIAVGLWTWRNRPDERFGQLLVAAGFGWFLTTLAESANSVLYSTGRVAAWAVEAGLVYLILAFPSGRLSQALDRKLAWSAAILVAALYLPSVLLDAHYSLPSPYTSCESGCPSNAFFLGSEPQFLDSVLLPLRAVLTVLLFLAVTARLAQRWQVASRLARRTLSPVLAVAIARCVAVAVGLGSGLISDAEVPDWLPWMIALAVPAMALAFLLGLFALRLYCAAALEKLGAGLRPNLSPVDFRAQLADALGDPSLRLFLWVSGPNGHWVDEQGAASPAPSARPDQHRTAVRDDGGPVAVIVHDTVLAHDPRFLEAVASFTLIALQNGQLAEKVASSLKEVRHSRARIVSAADGERRRIERDLHDGAQQRLVALRVQLELAEELVQVDQRRGLRKLHGLAHEVDETLDEIRALARGVYPPLLADSGLAEALGAAARKLPMHASVNPHGVVGRYLPDVESAVYFCCLEAMQNASKHAVGAHRVVISLHVDDRLGFEVRDDGAGFPNIAQDDGAGLTNMRDRIAAVGGDLEITSVVGEGTTVAGSVPLGEGATKESPKGDAITAVAPTASGQRPF
jgi:signal transduction histidine kinase